MNKLKDKLSELHEDFMREAYEIINNSDNDNYDEDEIEILEDKYEILIKETLLSHPKNMLLDIISEQYNKFQMKVFNSMSHEDLVTYLMTEGN